MTKEIHLKTTLLILLLILAVISRAQQTSVFTQYTLNKFLINPAVAGSEGFTTVNATAREQWVGFPGTPKTHAISIDARNTGNSYIKRLFNIRTSRRRPNRYAKNIAWGVGVLNDINGPLIRTEVNGTYAYHIDLRRSQLSFGASLLLNQLRINEGKLILADDQPDVVFTGQKSSVWIADANLGIYYIAKNYYSGYSILSLMESNVQFGSNTDAEYELNRLHYFFGGYLYNIDNKYTLEPSFLLKIQETGKMQLDIDIKYHILKIYWTGLAFRTGTALSFFAGVKIDRYYIGYAYDHNLNTLQGYTYGSHELMLSARFGSQSRRYRWLRSY